MHTSNNFSDEQAKNQDDFYLSRSTLRNNPFLNPLGKEAKSIFSDDNLESLEKFEDLDFSMHVEENPSPVVLGFCIDSQSELFMPVSEQPVATDPEPLRHDETNEQSFDFMATSIADSPSHISQ